MTVKTPSICEKALDEIIRELKGLGFNIKMVDYTKEAGICHIQFQHPKVDESPALPSPGDSLIGYKLSEGYYTVLLSKAYRQPLSIVLNYSRDDISKHGFLLIEIPDKNGYINMYFGGITNKDLVIRLVKEFYHTELGSPRYKR